MTRAGVGIWVMVLGTADIPICWVLVLAVHGPRFADGQVFSRMFARLVAAFGNSGMRSKA